MGRIDLRGGLWLALAAAAVLVAAMMMRARLGLAGAGTALCPLAAELLALFGGISLAGTLATYCVAAGTTGWVDPWLAAADRALGFDWPAAYRTVAASPVLRTLGHVAYSSIFTLPTFMLVGLAAHGRGDHARRFLLAFALALAVTVALFGWFPAVSAANYHLRAANDGGGLTGAHFLDVFAALRGHRLHAVPVNDLRGLITFPSFHAASGVLFCWAAWPLRRLRWPVAALSVAMIAATPIEGSHYLVDVIGGVLVALLAILAVRALVYAPTVSTTLPTWSPASR